MVLRRPRSPHPLTRPRAPRWSIAALISIGVLPPLALAVIGGQTLLEPVCSELMYARGWTFFALWLATASISMPLRAAESGWIRPWLHALGFGFSWCWWIVAIVAADLWSRADLLWIAYASVGVALIVWRCGGHRALLRATIRRILDDDPDCSTVECFATGRRRSPVSDSPRAIRGRSIMALARLRWHPWFAKPHRWIFGAPGSSLVVLEEAMDATDRRAGDLQRMLSDRNAPLDHLVQRLAGAWTLELRLVAGMREQLPDDGDLCTLRRSIGVLRDLSLAAIRSEQSTAIRAFADALRVLGEGPHLSARTIDLLARSCEAQPNNVAALLLEFDEAPRLSDAEGAILEVGCIVMLARLRIFRTAKARLAFWSSVDRSSIAPGAESLAASCELLAYAVASEVEAASIRTAAGQGEVPLDSTDLETVKRRSGHRRQLGRKGQHPEHGGSVRPSDFGLLPPPRRPREIGVGLLGLLAAVLLWGSMLVIPAWRPLPARLQVVFDVPFEGEVVADGVHAATVTGSESAPVILLADQSEGVRSLDVNSMRVRREGGQETALDGFVTKLGANPDGSAVAIFHDSRLASSCISVRSPDGRWERVIGPTELIVQGEEIEAAIDGLDKLCLLRSAAGGNRLLVYDEPTRSLRNARCDQPIEIQGRFVDSSSLDRSTALLLTDDPSKPIYRISPGSRGSDFAIAAVAPPPLEVGREAVAIAALPDGGGIIVDSRGGAWRIASSASMEWESVRAGDQGLALDAVDRVLVESDASRLWVLRNGRLWSRRLPDGKECPSSGEGWTSVSLDLGGPGSMDHRLALAELEGSEGIVVMQPAGGTDSRGFAFFVHHVEDPSSRRGRVLRIHDLLEQSEPGQIKQLVDCDHHGGSILLQLDVIAKAEEQVRRILTRLEPGVNGVPFWQSIRSTRAGDASASSLSEPILGLDHSEPERPVVLLRDGTWFQFSATTDVLLGAEGKSAGATCSTAVDAALVKEEDGARAAMVLDKSGSVVKVALAQPAREERVVDASSGVPSDVVTQASATFSTRSGAVVIAGESAWEFSLENAGAPWRQVRQGDVMGRAPVIGIDQASQPVAAWIDGVNRIESLHLPVRLANRAFGQANIEKILPGFGTPFFVRFEGKDGGWTALDAVGQVQALLPSTSDGPNSIRGVNLRDGFADYLAEGTLHSLSLSDGRWSASIGLQPDGPYALRRSEDGGGEVLLLIPESRSGLAYALNAGQDASQLRRLFDTPHRSMVPLGAGVAGFSEAVKALAWHPVDKAVKPYVLPTKPSVPGINLGSVAEAVVRGEHIWLRSADETGRIVSYPLSERRAFHIDIPGLTAFSVARNAVFALARGSLVKLDANTLQKQDEWTLPRPAASVLLGTSDSDTAVVLVDGSIYVFPPQNGGNGPNLKPVLNAPARRDPTQSAPIEIKKVAAAGSRLIVFTADGAWTREASADSPFTRCESVHSLPEALAFPPEGSWPWAKVGDRWYSLEGGANNPEPSIGWLAPNRTVQTLLDSREVRIAGAAVPSFQGSPVELSPPFAVAPWPGGQALVLGESGAALFDAATQVWRSAPGMLQDFTSECERIPDGAGGLLLYQSNRLVATTGAGDCLLVHPPAARESRSADAIAAVTDGRSVFRVLGGTRKIQRIDGNSLTHETLVGQADDVARTASGVFWFNRSERRIFSIDGAKSLDASDWFDRAGTIAYVDGSGAIRTISDPNRVGEVVLPASDAVPGTLIGIVPGSSTALFRGADGGFGLYDARAGRIIRPRLEGVDPLIGADGVYVVQRMLDGKREKARAICYSADGTARASDRFDAVHVSSTSTCIRVLALWRDNDRVEIGTLHPRTLRREPETFRRSSAIPWSYRSPLAVSQASSGITVLPHLAGSRIDVALTTDRMSMLVLQNVEVEPCHAANEPAEALLTMSGNELRVKIGGEWFLLGSPRKDAVLDGHRVLKAAPLSLGRYAWIDQLGQLWWGSNDLRTPVSGVKDATDFLIDRDGRLYVQCADQVRQLVEDGAQAPRVEPADTSELFHGGGRLPGSCGSIGWSSPPKSRDPLLWNWQPKPGPGIAASRIPVKALETEFERPAITSITTTPEGPAAVGVLGQQSLLVPIRAETLRWDEARVTKPPAQMPASPSSVTTRNFTLRAEDRRLQLEVGAAVYPYLRGWRRFTCSVCTAATACGQELITAGEEVPALLRWKVGGDGVATLDAATIPLPQGAESVLSLAPGSAADSFIASLRMQGDEVPRAFLWRAGDWSEFVDTPFVAGPRARWAWDPKERETLRLDQAWSYKLVLDGEPRLDCDLVEPFREQGQGREVQESLHVTAGGRIQYRGHNGAWFEIGAGQMPEPKLLGNEPESPRTFNTQLLEIDRFPAPGESEPRLRMRLGGQFDAQFPVRVRSGLLESVDDWVQAADLYPDGPNGVRAVHGGIERPIRLVGGRLESLPPRVKSPDPAEERFDPRLKVAGGLEVTPQGELSNDGESLGIPSPRGLSALDPRQIVPIALTLNPPRLIASCRDGRIFSLDPSDPIRTFRRHQKLEGVRSIESVAWEQIEGQVVLVATYGALDGSPRRFRIDPANHQLLAETREKEGLLCIEASNEQSLRVTRDKLELRIQREDDPPCDIRCILTSGIQTKFAHADAQRITVHGRDMRTFGTSWLVHYRDPDGDGQWRIESVRKAQPPGTDIAPVELELGGGLHARRESSEWVLYAGKDPTAVRWPLSSLRSADRAYVLDKDSLLEFGQGWSRFMSMGGEIKRRGMAFDPALASVAAYRGMDGIAAEGRQFRLSSDGTVAEQIGVVSPPPGHWEARGPGPWGVSLDRAGAACEIRYDGRRVAVRDGALDLDYSLAATCIQDDTWLADRHAVCSISGKSDLWTRHDAAIGAMLSSAPPRRMMGVAAGQEITRCILIPDPRTHLVLNRSADAKPRLEQREIGDELASWASAANMVLAVDMQGSIRIRRTIGSQQVEYPAIPLRDAIRNGRLAFDIPVDVFLAKSPTTAIPSACIEMQLGWEWLDGTGNDTRGAVALRRPEQVPTAYGALLNADWLKDSDLAGRSGELQLAVQSQVGQPLLWYPHGNERIFLIGTRSAVWIELGWRWSGRSLVN